MSSGRQRECFRDARVVTGGLNAQLQTGSSSFLAGSLSHAVRDFVQKPGGRRLLASRCPGRGRARGPLLASAAAAIRRRLCADADCWRHECVIVASHTIGKLRSNASSMRPPVFPRTGARRRAAREPIQLRPH